MQNESETQFALALGKRVRAQRLRRALSQQELADFADVSRNVIINVERGYPLPRPKTIRKLAAAFDVSVAQLTEGE
jgi:transcriptional regulator with XRE-family HTH domain